MKDFYGRVRKVLDERGINKPPEGSFQLQDRSDGKGPFIGIWNEKVLGPIPTKQELLRVKPEDAKIFAIKNRKDQDLEDRRMRALEKAVYQLIKAAAPTRTVTPQQWKAMLHKAWEDVGDND
ncbi:MAG: hypothetical protein AB7J46_06430 [Candidatus Altimarinota bacterium]